MADINERVNIDTGDAVKGLGNLETAAGDADKKLDTLKETADKTDSATVDIPVETPGAVDAADQLDKVDDAARRAGDGAKVGTSSISDLAGPLGDSAGKAGEMGAAVEGLGSIIESMGAKAGLSAEQTAKLQGALAAAAVFVAAGTVLWAEYNKTQDEVAAKKQATIDALEATRKALAEGNTDAAAQSFMDTFGDSIAGIAKKTGIASGDIIKGVLGDQTAFDTLKGKLDESSSGFLQMGTAMEQLRSEWQATADRFKESTAMKQTVVETFNQMGTAASDFAGSAEDAAMRAEYAWIRMREAANPTGPSSSVPTPFAKTPGGGIDYTFGQGTTINYFPPANTPLAVEHASAEYVRINGPV